jgi:hypothetical protein
MSDVRWKGLDHEAIHKMINDGPGASASGPNIEFWGTLSKGLADISKNLDNRLAKLKVNWEGQAGDNATGSMSPLSTWAGRAEQGSNVMKASFEMQGDYVGQARAEVPEPVQVTTPTPSGWQMAAAGASLLTGNPGPALSVANQAQDHEAQERAQDEAARKAVKAMEKYEESSELNAATLGRFDPPPTVVVNAPTPSGNPNSSTFSTSGFHPQETFSTGHSTSEQTYTPPQTHTSTYTPPATYTPQQPQQPVGHQVPTYQSTDPSHVTPPVIEPPVNRPDPFPRPNPIPGPGPFPPGEGPFFTGGPGGGPGGPGGSFNEPGGRGGIGGQGGQGGRGGLGGSGQGFGQNAVDAEGRQLGRGGAGGMNNALMQEGMGRGGVGPNAAGGRGGAGGGPMGAGGRGKGEDDDEHETPSYLLETEDVFGDERMVAPPVIGERPEQ